MRKSCLVFISVCVVWTSHAQASPRAPPDIRAHLQTTEIVFLLGTPPLMGFMTAGDCNAAVTNARTQCRSGLAASRRILETTDVPILAPSVEPTPSPSAGTTPSPTVPPTLATAAPTTPTPTLTPTTLAPTELPTLSPTATESMCCEALYDASTYCDQNKPDQNQAFHDVARTARCTTIRLGFLFPTEIGPADIGTTAGAVSLAVKAINADPSVLGNYTIVLSSRPADCEKDDAQQSTVQLIASGVLGLVGPTCSGASTPCIVCVKR
jgi:hypothetical protein